MQTWLGFALICLITALLGLYLGRRGLRGTFVDAPGSHRVGLLILASLPLYVTLWLQEAHGFTATPTHIVTVSAAFCVGLLAGKVQPRDAVTNAHGESYSNDRFGFSLYVPPGWTRRPMQDQFKKAGGQLVIWSPQEQPDKANLNVAVGPPEDQQMLNKGNRANKLRSLVGPTGQIDTALQVSGESNCVRADWSEVKSVFGKQFPAETGLLSVIHNDLEYVIQWTSSPRRMRDVNGIISSLSFRT